MEITEIDRNLTYYKILNEDENHNGLQYHTGLVEDMLPFESDTERSCVKGRIYITILENLPIFFGHGCWIRPCWIPEDAQALIDPQGDKIGVDKAFFGDRFSFAEYFDTLFDPDKFNWDYSDYLAEHCFKYFDKWFFHDKYNWILGSWALAAYCSYHFDKWFDTDRFNWGESYYLAMFCYDHFDKWFNFGKYNWVFSRHLIVYCSEHFSKWFCPLKFNRKDLYYLAKYCPDKKHIWSQYTQEV